MTTDHIPLLDAALDVFLRYGFKRTTMGHIAKAAALSRPSLYARYANKDEVYAAVLQLHIHRMIADLKTAWATCDTLDQKIDRLWDISIRPSFEMLTTHPDASDIIEGSDTPAGQVAMAATQKQIVTAFTDLLAPYHGQLGPHGQTPEQLSIFIEQNKLMMMRTAKNLDDLNGQFSTLKAAILALTS